jgi:hypothetical protein
MVNKDKKVLLNEGRQVTNGSFSYGGFPRLLNENQGEIDPFKAAQKRRRAAGENLVNSIYTIDPKTEPERRKKYAQTISDFLNGNMNLADDALSMGANPEDVDSVVDWGKNPDFVKRDKEEIEASTSSDVVMGRTIRRKDGTMVAPGDWTGD